MTGFIAFKVIAGAIVILSHWGAIEDVKSFENEQGHYRIVLTQDEGQTEDYQVSVSNDGAPITFQIINRRAIDFDIGLFCDGLPYIPDTRCTITIERKPNPLP